MRLLFALLLSLPAAARLHPSDVNPPPEASADEHADADERAEREEAAGVGRVNAAIAALEAGKSVAPAELEWVMGWIRRWLEPGSLQALHERLVRQAVAEGKPEEVADEELAGELQDAAENNRQALRYLESISSRPR